MLLILLLALSLSPAGLALPPMYSEPAEEEQSSPQPDGGAPIYDYSAGQNRFNSQQVGGFPYVTKDPTSETIEKGGFAEFVAKADGCDQIVWYFLSPDGATKIRADDGLDFFAGIKVIGQGTERLVVDNVPTSMSEWRVKAEFIGGGGSVWSGAAVIRVLEPELTAPIIKTHPKSTQLAVGESASLKVRAVSEQEDVKLLYQWYENTLDANSGGRKIKGATSATYIPAFSTETLYYYCVVRTSNGTETSEPSVTKCAAISYVEAQPDSRPTEPETRPTQPATQPTTPVTQPTEPVTEPTVPPTEPVTEPTVPPPTEPLVPAVLVRWNPGPLTVIETRPTEAAPVTAPSAAGAGTKSISPLLVLSVSLVAIGLIGIVITAIGLKTTSNRDKKRKATRKPSPPPRRQPVQPQPDQWDDLSDLEELDIYLDEDLEDLEDLLS